MLRALNVQGDEIAGFLSIVLGAHFKDDMTITPARLQVRLLGDQSRSMTRIVDLAIARGELPGGPLPSRLLSLPGDLMRYELIMRLGRVPDEAIVDIVDTVFMPLVAVVSRDDGAAPA